MIGNIPRLFYSLTLTDAGDKDIIDEYDEHEIIRAISYVQDECLKFRLLNVLKQQTRPKRIMKKGCKIKSYGAVWDEIIGIIDNMDGAVVAIKIRMALRFPRFRGIILGVPNED